MQQVKLVHASRKSSPALWLVSLTRTKLGPTRQAGLPCAAEGPCGNGFVRMCTLNPQTLAFLQFVLNLWACRAQMGQGFCQCGKISARVLAQGWNARRFTILIAPGSCHAWCQAKSHYGSRTKRIRNLSGVPHSYGGRSAVGPQCHQGPGVPRAELQEN